MPPSELTRWYHANKYAEDSACEHCGGIIRHERWCITRNALVAYAYAAVLDPAKLSVGDKLILHALGVAWEKVCQATCRG